MAPAGDVNFSPGLPFLVSGEACFAVLFDCCCCRNRCRLSRPTLPRIYARCNIFFLVSGFFRIFHRIFSSFFIDYAPNTAPVFPQHTQAHTPPPAKTRSLSATAPPPEDNRSSGGVVYRIKIANLRQQPLHGQGHRRIPGASGGTSSDSTRPAPSVHRESGSPPESKYRRKAVPHGRVGLCLRTSRPYSWRQCPHP